MKYAIVTFGCRVNQADSLSIEQGLRARGGIDVPSADADLVVINTCSVTASADQGARVNPAATRTPDSAPAATGAPPPVVSTTAKPDAVPVPSGPVPNGGAPATDKDRVSVAVEPVFFERHSSDHLQRSCFEPVFVASSRAVKLSN